MSVDIVKHLNFAFNISSDIEKHVVVGNVTSGKQQEAYTCVLEFEMSIATNKKFFSHTFNFIKLIFLFSLVSIILQHNSLCMVAIFPKILILQIKVLRQFLPLCINCSLNLSNTNTSILFSYYYLSN